MLSLLQIVIDPGTPTFNFLTAGTLALLFVKILFILAGLLYVIFGVIVIRQVYVMRQTLATPFSPIILFLGYLHLFVAILIFLFFLAL